MEYIVNLMLNTRSSASKKLEIEIPVGNIQFAEGTILNIHTFLKTHPGSTPNALV